MIRTYFLLALFCLSIDALNAQSIRFSGGTNIRSFTQEYQSFTSDARLGYSISADVQFPSRKRMYLQPGLQYVVNSNNFSHSHLAEENSSLSVSGLKIPVLVGFNLFQPNTCLKSKGKYRNIQLFTGPAFTNILKVKHTGMTDPTHLITDKEYHDVEWAWQLGAGFQYSLFFMDLGFQKGFTYTFTGGGQAKSNQFYMNVGMQIPLKKTKASGE